LAPGGRRARRMPRRGWCIGSSRPAPGAGDVTRCFRRAGTSHPPCGLRRPTRLPHRFTQEADRAKRAGVSAARPVMERFVYVGGIAAFAFCSCWWSAVSGGRASRAVGAPLAVAIGATLLRSRRDGRQRDEASPCPFNGERAGVRGEKIEKRPISPADLQEDRPHLTLPSPLPPGAERIRRTSSRLDRLNPVGTRSTASPSLDLQWGDAVECVPTSAGGEVHGEGEAASRCRPSCGRLRMSCLARNRERLSAPT